MQEFRVGFSRCDITPPIGAGLAGSIDQRLSIGVLDPLTASALAFGDGKEIYFLLSLDILCISGDCSQQMRAAIEERTGVPAANILVHCTHTHSAHSMRSYHIDFDKEQFAVDCEKIAAAAKEALSDMAPAKVYVNAANTPVKISFIRRFRMKDGTTRTNPGFLNPDIDHPLGEADHRVALTLFKREGKPEIALVNFQTHACVVPNGTDAYRISADYPHHLRQTYEAAMPGSVCMFINGAEGDTNHYNVKTPQGMPRTGYTFAAHMGRTIAGVAMALHAMAEPIEPLPLRALRSPFGIAYNKESDPAALRRAEEVLRLHDEGRDGELSSLGGMDLITKVAAARRMLNLRDKPDEITITLTALRVGELALIGIPGEPFTEIGTSIKETSPAKMTFVACCADDYAGYFPMKSAYDEGGYEAGTANYRAGTAEKVIEMGKATLAELYTE